MFDEMRETCCAKADAAGSAGDCDSAAWPKGPAFLPVMAFAADENAWLESYAEAWQIATENGHLDLKSLSPDAAAGETYECGKLRSRSMCKKDDES